MIKFVQVPINLLLYFILTINFEGFIPKTLELLLIGLLFSFYSHLNYSD